MGRVVSAVAMTHNPRIFWNFDAASEQDRAAVFGQFEQASASVTASRPDVVVVVANDHLDQFSMDCMPSFCVATCETISGPFWYESDVMNMPWYSGPVATDFAEDLLYRGMQMGVELTRLGRATIDHAFTVPLSQLVPDADVPVVPVYTNTFGYPLPLNERFHRLGQVIRATIESRPAGERVAVIGSFNLSVCVGGPQMGQRNPEFDERAMELMQEADIDRLVNDRTIRELIDMGNSTAEYLNYLAIVGAVGERRPDHVWYRLVEGWGGCPIVVWDRVDDE